MTKSTNFEVKTIVMVGSFGPSIWETSINDTANSTGDDNEVDNVGTKSHIDLPHGHQCCTQHFCQGQKLSENGVSLCACCLCCICHVPFSSVNNVATITIALLMKELAQKGRDTCIIVSKTEKDCLAVVSLQTALQPRHLLAVRPLPAVAMLCSTFTCTQSSQNDKTDNSWL